MFEAAGLPAPESNLTSVTTSVDSREKVHLRESLFTMRYFAGPAGILNTPPKRSGLWNSCTPSRYTVNHATGFRVGPPNTSTLCRGSASFNPTTYSIFVSVAQARQNTWRAVGSSYGTESV